ncbi:MAG: hypothetical protein J0M00_08915 [Burkholderiales bacterium]|nr:hypothetical protein [Burkholderiales bacterium]
MLREQSDEWSLQRCCTQLEGLQALSDTVPACLPAVARSVPRVSALFGLWCCTMRWDTICGIDVGRKLKDRDVQSKVPVVEH